MQVIVGLFALVYGALLFLTILAVPVVGVLLRVLFCWYTFLCRLIGWEAATALSLIVYGVAACAYYSNH